jgi:hypothetical protein
MTLQFLRGSWAAYIMSLTTAGCASTQINSNTLDIASTYDELITKQVTFNIRKTFEDPYGLPAYVKVTAQTATTQNSITPMLTLPLSNQVSNVAQLTQMSSGLTTQTSRTFQFAGKSFGLSATDQWNQTYTITPVTDTDQLRRLRILFQYVTRQLVDNPLGDPPQTDTKEFESLYPIIEVSGAGTTNPATTLTITVDGKPVSVKQANDQPDKVKQTYVRRTYRWSPCNPSDSSPDCTAGKIKFDGYTWILVTPDITFIKQPGCILCDYQRKLSREELALLPTDMSPKDKAAAETAHKLEKNVDLRNDWLYAPGDTQGPDAVRLPSNGFDSIYIKKTVNDDPDGGRRYFYEFALFTGQAASEGTGSPSSDGQSLGRKTAPLQRISIPVGGINSAP